jgi:3-oxoacid CoA-transferase subunit A
MKFIITGDTHGKVEQRLFNISHNMNIENPKEIGVIILGDAGLNFYLNKTDIKHKKELDKYGFQIYCVRGNHEERPENLGYELVYDENVNGEVYIDSINPNIKYFKDGGEYDIEGHKTLVIGGAYSVDKKYRLLRAGLTEEINDPKKSGWFSDETLSNQEKYKIQVDILNKEYDLILTHTCPYEFEPTDLFLNFINQEEVDKSMEYFLDWVKDNTKWKVWLFGHYHADRVERPGVQQFYQSYDFLTDIFERWKNNE